MLTLKKRWSAAGLIFLGIVAGIIFSSQLRLTPAGFAGKVDKSDSEFLGNTSESPKVAPDPQAVGKAFTVVAKEVLPTVVSISSTIKGTEARGEQHSINDLFRLFEQPQRGERGQRPQRGMGSGVIISSDGYILTNHHVIDKAEDIKVTLYDNRAFKAHLIGTDPLTEIALIQIDCKDLPAIRLGNSDELEIGEWVLAFGNPLNLTSTVTAGIVSAIGRGIDIIRNNTRNIEGGSLAIESFIQTDAAINPGNSGGALVNLNSELIGINTAIATGTGYNNGAGFAVPINLANKIVKDFIKYGHVNRPWLGISMKNVDDIIAARFKMKKPKGVYIDQVLEDTPAEKAGLKFLDIILKVDGKVVNRSNKIQSLIAIKNPGDEIDLTILRKGKEKEITVKLGKRKEKDVASKKEKIDDFPDLGLVVGNIDERDQYQLDYEGVIVEDVKSYSPAYDANIRRGHIITHIEDQPVRSVSEYRRTLRKYKKGDVVIFHLRYRDQKSRAFVKIE